VTAANPDLSDLSGCRPGTSCIQYADLGGRPDYFSCAIPGIVPDGGACQFHPECAAGLGCFGSVCSRWCASATDCGDGFACSNITEESGLALGFCCAVPAGQTCNPTTNCGCNAGTTCAVENGEAVCRPVQQGGVGPYEACDADAQCPAQHVCIDGACALVCGNSNDCGTPEARCYVPNGTATSVCSRSCDPLSPQAPAPGYEPCGAGLTCTDFFVDTGLFFTCMRPGLLPEGAECSTDETPAPCQEGLSCFDVCEPFCEIGTTCDTGDCLLVNPPYPVVNGREVGICP
jgi:hypothetical protein